MAITVLNDAPDLMSLLPAMPNPTQTWHCFSSPEATCDYLDTVRYFWDNNGTEQATSKYGVSFYKAKEYAREGWPEGTERVARLRDRINAQNPVGPRLVKYDVAGAYPIVPRAIAGNPMNMKRYDTTRLRRKPVITLINHMGGLLMVPAECFVNKCAVVAAIVDAIENAGYSCHVVGLSMSSVEASHSSYMCGYATTIKQPGESVDIARMAFALGHVSMFRRLVFAVRGSEQRNAPLGHSLGHTIDFPPHEPLPATYILPSMNTNYQYFKDENTTATAGLGYLTQHLAAQGCPAFPNLSQAA